MSIFHFPKIDLKKTIHFTHFGVRPTNLMRLTFMLWMEERCGATTRPLCSQPDDHINFAKDGVGIGESLFL